MSPAGAPSRAGVEAAGAVARLAPIGLAEVLELADLQTRVDRKYVLTDDVVGALVAQVLPDAAVLTIDGATEHGYVSVYFDTPDLQSYRGAAHGRRRRFKVRTRTYLDTGGCVLEVKTRGARGETVKERVAHEAAPDRLDEGDRRFARDVLGDGAPVEDLRATLTTRYRRSTVVDPAGGLRMTVDRGLVCTDPGRRHARLRGVVLETKSPGAATAVDRWLWAAGHRPWTISKYCVGLAAIDPDLPANRWARTLSRAF